MQKLKVGLLASVLTVSACLLSGCGQVDETIFESNADFSVNINVPYSTTTPLPAELDVAEQVVIDSNGSVTVNDKSLLYSSYTRTKDDEEQYSTLSLGDTGTSVQALQQRLKELGYFESGVSGVFDAETQTAVIRFEQTYGIMQTGIATASFQAKLFSSDAPYYGSEAYESAVVSQYTTLQKGATGSSVYALQHRLKELGYPITDLSGVYDDATENAVKLFAQAYGQESQTVAYIALQKELYSDSAIAYSDSTQTESGNTTLSLGSVGTQVSKIQNRLIELGYLEGSATGVFDSETEAAVMLFQTACGEASNGSLTPAQQTILLSDSAPAFDTAYNVKDYQTLQEGSQGDTVTELQNRLIELGYAVGSGNGVYGTETTTAVKMFQHYNGLNETGIATAEVQTKLFSSNALSYQDVLNNASNPTPTVSVTETPAPDGLSPQTTLNPITGYRVLTLGCSGDDVSKLQQRLSSLGYDCSTDGNYDDSTVTAMKGFQAAIGMTQTGEASESMQAYIYTKAAPASTYKFYNSTQDFTTLQQGDTGELVTKLQQQLWRLGYLLTADVQDSVGTYHDKTAEAVAAAQEAMGYADPDGIASPEFQCFLFSEYNTYIQK